MAQIVQEKLEESLGEDPVEDVEAKPVASSSVKVRARCSFILFKLLNSAQIVNCVIVLLRRMMSIPSLEEHCVNLRGETKKSIANSKSCYGRRRYVLTSVY